MSEQKEIVEGPIAQKSTVVSIVYARLCTFSRLHLVPYLDRKLVYIIYFIIMCIIIIEN